MFSEAHKKGINESVFHYESLFNKYSPSEAHKVLDWESSQAQLSRFYVLVENIDIRNKKILDAGCGLGNLYEFLSGLDSSFQYSGVDISKKLISYCNKTYPDAFFYCADLINC